MSTYIYIYNNGVTGRASRYRTEKRGGGGKGNSTLKRKGKLLTFKVDFNDN